MNRKHLTSVIKMMTKETKSSAMVIATMNVSTTVDNQITVKVTCPACMNERKRKLRKWKTPGYKWFKFTCSLCKTVIKLRALVKYTGER